MSDAKFVSCKPLDRNRYSVEKVFDGGARVVKVIKLAGDAETAVQRAKHMGFITQDVSDFRKDGNGLYWGDVSATVSPAEPEDDDCMYVAIATVNGKLKHYGPFMTHSNAEQFVATTPSDWNVQIKPLLLAELPVA